MKRKDFEKIQTMSAAELVGSISEAREKLWTTKRDIEAGKAKNVKAGRGVRRDIARMLTLLNSKHEARNPKKIQNTKS